MELSIQIPFGQLQIFLLVPLPSLVASLRCPRNWVKCSSRFPPLQVIALMESKDPSAECLGKASGTQTISILEIENHRKFGLERTQEFPLHSLARARSIRCHSWQAFEKASIDGRCMTPQKKIRSCCLHGQYKFPLVPNLNPLLCSTMDTEDYLVSLHLLCTYTWPVVPPHKAHLLLVGFSISQRSSKVQRLEAGT